MNIEQLKHVMEVARSGSFTRAAENAHITVTGISRSISLFEKEIGMPIFTRSRTGAVLTPEGEKITTKIAGILNQIGELKLEASSYSEMNNAKLRLSAIPGPISLLIDILTDMKHEFPGCRIEITEDNTERVIEDVQSGQSDLGFVQMKEHLLHRHPGLLFDKLTEDRVIIVANARSPLAQIDSIQKQDLLKVPFVLYNDPNIIEFVKMIGPDVDILFKSNNVDALIKAVKSNLAVTVATSYSLQAYTTPDNPEMVNIPFQLPAQGKSYLCLVTSRDHSLSRAARLFIQRFKNSLQ
ncbi:LysR family transcriptional regulator [Paenibacillus sp. Z6-24]